ncbi:hypothetical protein CEXT_792371 [Caerostris extrusa]|uniref:Uncharacterized protein n=1 Tax=Caerostris extrusa TaxID=172846 RepID=A0AAV4TAA7_CAEEX|nr:hypothetical protein CEXT_792371 [Caerostris extrusa]
MVTWGRHCCSKVQSWKTLHHDPCMIHHRWHLNGCRDNVACQELFPASLSELTSLETTIDRLEKTFSFPPLNHFE